MKKIECLEWMRYLYIGYNDWLSLKKWGQSVKVRNLPCPFLRGLPLNCCFSSFEVCVHCWCTLVITFHFIRTDARERVYNYEIILFHAEEGRKVYLKYWSAYEMKFCPTFLFYNNEVYDRLIRNFWVWASD